LASLDGNKHEMISEHN